MLPRLLSTTNPTWLITFLFLLVLKKTKSPFEILSFEMRFPFFAISLETLGKEIFSFKNEVYTNPEQSIPNVVVPPYL